MSTGAFIIARYAATYGAGTNVHPIKIQPETATLVVGGVTNSIPTASVNNQISARVAGGKRAIGLNARRISFRFSGTPPTGSGYLANSIITLPWLSPFTTPVARGATGTYQTGAIVVVGLSPEIAK